MTETVYRVIDMMRALLLLTILGSYVVAQDIVESSWPACTSDMQVRI